MDTSLSLSLSLPLSLFLSLPLSPSFSSSLPFRRVSRLQPLVQGVLLSQKNNRAVVCDSRTKCSNDLTHTCKSTDTLSLSHTHTHTHTHTHSLSLSLPQTAV